MFNVSNLISGVVNIGPVPCYPVDALCWDITLGTAGTPFGQFILEKTSSSSEMVPEAVDHVGIIVYGYLYEYGDCGILKTAAPLQSSPKSKYPVFSLRSREKVGDTEKTQDQFEKWVNEMNASEFLGSNYNVVTTSCIVWGIKACEFLGVSYPENWSKICNWAAENSKVAGMLGGSGVQSRKVQIRAQASEKPKKIKEYIKKKLRRSDSDTSSSSSDPDKDTDTTTVSLDKLRIATEDENYNQSTRL